MRASGILLHISSLPEGNIGASAFEFIDFLKSAGQRYWQMLPIGHTGKGNSPYSSPSAFACNTDFTDRASVISDCKGLDEFCAENEYWLNDYALFMALREENGGNWLNWDPSLKFRDQNALESAKIRLEKQINNFIYEQFLFDFQWKRLKKYANENGVELIGDIPIYVALNSADVWSNPHLFELSENLEPTAVSGCPPDDFAPRGQLWGNPLYRWDVMENRGYKWWIERIKKLSSLFDVIRIDHFRGFESYYSIDSHAADARNGIWRKGPGIKLFNAAANSLGTLNIIAEDLGFITPEVREFLNETGYPGMKILQFAFDGDPENEFLPDKFTRNCVAYTGTHDNDTIRGWAENLTDNEFYFAGKYLNVNSRGELPQAAIHAVFRSIADTVIIPAQDFLNLPSGARMNIPATESGNWEWRASKGDFNEALAGKIRKLTQECERLS